MRLFRSDRPDYVNGGQLRDFVYVQDCADVVLWLLDHREVSGLFNLGTGKARTWLDLAHAMFDAAEQPRRVEFIDMPPGLSGQYQYFTQARMERLRSAGYDKPFTALEDGIRQYIRNYLATKDPYL
jgi:ADP-L-glycero-D-manno-heptose 6-epimerase